MIYKIHNITNWLIVLQDQKYILHMLHDVKDVSLHEVILQSLDDILPPGPSMCIY